MSDLKQDPFAPRDTAAFMPSGDRRESNRHEVKARIRTVEIGSQEVGEFHDCKGVLSLPGFFIEADDSGILTDEPSIVELEIPTGANGDPTIVRAPVRPTKRRSGYLVMFDEDDFDLARQIAQYLDSIAGDRS